MSRPTIYDFNRPILHSHSLGEYIDILGIHFNNHRLTLFLQRLVAGHNNCIICTYAANTWYPRVGFSAQQRVNAHRVAYALWVDPEIPTECQICHTCDNPRCVNPNHLYLGDAWSNRWDAVERGRANIVPRRPGQLHLLPQMRQLRSAGLSYENIGKQLKLSWQTIRTYLLKYGEED